MKRKNKTKQYKSRNRKVKSKFWSYTAALLTFVALSAFILIRLNLISNPLSYLNWQGNRVTDPLLDVDYPALQMSLDGGVQLNIPYYNQNDPRWANRRYGTDASKTLAENGCALVALAMVESYLSDERVTPDMILSWSGDQYYVHEQGTSWSIFNAYGQDYGRQVIEIGNHLERAKEYLDYGYAIIVSVGPGHFTAGGHLMLLRGYGTGYVLINDPNDSQHTQHTLSMVSDDLLARESLNYWAVGTY